MKHLTKILTLRKKTQKILLSLFQAKGEAEKVFLKNEFNAIMSKGVAIFTENFLKCYPQVEERIAHLVKSYSISDKLILNLYKALFLRGKFSLMKDKAGKFYVKFILLPRGEKKKVVFALFKGSKIEAYKVLHEVKALKQEVDLIFLRSLPDSYIERFYLEEERDERSM